MPRHNYRRNSPRPLHRDFVELMLAGKSTVTEKPSRKRSKREGRERAAYHS